MSGLDFSMKWFRSHVTPPRKSMKTPGRLLFEHVRGLGEWESQLPPVKQLWEDDATRFIAAYEKQKVAEEQGR